MISKSDGGRRRRRGRGIEGVTIMSIGRVKFQALAFRRFELAHMSASGWLGILCRVILASAIENGIATDLTAYPCYWKPCAPCYQCDAHPVPCGAFSLHCNRCIWDPGCGPAPQSQACSSQCEDCQRCALVDAQPTCIRKLGYCNFSTLAVSIFHSSE